MGMWGISVVMQGMWVERRKMWQCRKSSCKLKYSGRDNTD